MRHVIVEEIVKRCGGSMHTVAGIVMFDVNFPGFPVSVTQ